MNNITFTKSKPTSALTKSNSEHPSISIMALYKFNLDKIKEVLL